MKEKAYLLGVVAFGYSVHSQKWEFKTVGTEKVHTLLTKAPGGVGTARKIANVINGSIKRVNFVDNLARFHIGQLTKTV